MTPHKFEADTYSFDTHPPHTTPASPGEHDKKEKDDTAALQKQTPNEGPEQLGLAF